MSEETTTTETASSQTVGDVVHAGIRAVLSAIPYVGGPSAVLFESVFQKPFERRRDATLAMFESALAELQSRPEVDFNSLRDHDEFCEFAHDVLRTASGTYRQEKLQALRNTMVNAALPNSPCDTKARIYLGLIDELDVHDLLMLDLLADPQAFLEKRGKSLPQPGDRSIEMDAATSHESPRSLASIISNEISDILPDDLTDVVLQKLVRRGLSAPGALSELCTPGRSFASPFGREFIRFISTSG